MGKIIQTDLGALANSGFQRISLGLKPSGLIHLGTAVTFLNGVVALVGNPKAHLEVTVMDLDFDFQRGFDFMSYQGKPDPEGCHELMKGHTEQEARETIDEIAQYFAIERSRIRVKQFGDITENSQFQHYLMLLFGLDGGRRLLTETVVGGNAKSTALLSPICDLCKHSSTYPPKYEENGRLMLRTKCYNDECSAGEYRVGLTEPRKVNIFYLVDPVRDIIPDEGGVAVDLHIFGGDYGLDYGNGGTPKADRVFRLMSGLSDSPPSIYVGPILTSNQIKVGKSRQNGFAVRSIRDMYQNWVERLYELLKDNPNARTLELSAVKHFS